MGNIILSPRKAVGMWSLSLALNSTKIKISVDISPLSLYAWME